MALDLFKDPKQTDDKVDAVHDESNTDKADQRELVVAQCLSYLANARR